MKNQISVIGSGRWGTFQAWHASLLFKKVILYSRASAPDFQTLLTTRKNEYLELNDNIELSSDLKQALTSDTIIISIGSQNLRGLAKELNTHDLKGKTFILCMKGLEKGTGKRLTQIMEEEINQDIELAIWVGPGHVQEFVKRIPNCMVIDSKNPETTKKIVDNFSSEMIRFYYGNDLIGNEIGAATKNVIGIAAGILDGLGYSSLKGALMSRATKEISRLIDAEGGNPMSAYGLAHLGDYEATLFSPHSHNRKYGENLVKGIKMEKLAEGVDTLEATHNLCKKHQIQMPITQGLYKVIFEGKDLKENFAALFSRPQKKEF